jgi:hypothetical protein
MSANAHLAGTVSSASVLLSFTSLAIYKQVKRLLVGILARGAVRGHTIAKVSTS